MPIVKLKQGPGAKIIQLDKYLKAKEAKDRKRRIKRIIKHAEKLDW